MPRHRSLNLRKFLDPIPEALLKEYFVMKMPEGIPQSIKSYDYESIKAYLESIKDDQLERSILEDFTHINDVCEKVMNFLITAINNNGIEISKEKNREELSMCVFLHHKDAFEYAYDHYCLYNSSSKMSHHRIASENFTLTSNKIERFKEKLINFYANLAKGQECDIRHYNEDNQTVIVIIHGSYKRSVAIWKKHQLDMIYFRPAHEDVLLYKKGDSVLSIKAPYKKDKENYIKAFTEIILEDKDQFNRPDLDITYSLGPLQDGSFSFYGNELISSITLLEVKLRLRGRTNPDIIIKSGDVLKTLGEDFTTISLNSGELVHAKFRFRLNVEGKTKNVTFEITPPNVTDLTRKKHAEIIGDYLKENGIKLV